MVSGSLTASKIQTMTEEELQGRLKGLRALIQARKQEGSSTEKEELDFCYLAREAQAREDRKRLEALAG